MTRRKVMRLAALAAPVLAGILPRAVALADAPAYAWTDISSHLSSPRGVPNLSDVQFIGEEGWVTTSSWAEVYHTTNGGATYEVLPSDLPLTSICMLSNLEGYAGVNGDYQQDGQVHSTGDGGDTWSAVAGNAGGKVTAVSYPPSSSVGYVCGAAGKFARVSAAAVMPIVTGTAVGLKALSFPVSTDEGWVLGETVILHYLDGSWLSDQVLAPGFYNSVHFVDNLNGWAVGSDGVIAHTTDGKHWTAQNNPDPGQHDLNDVHFVNVDEGWAVGYGGIVLHTTDGGATWQVEAAGLTGKMLTAVFAVDSHTVYAVGYSGAVLKYGADPTAGNHLYLPLNLGRLRA
ncbi:MAG: WD40/YVTN/BNR-like repeat-containing protein [Anaerolineae bacterium]